MAFPTTPVLDTFTRANGALGAGWTAISTGGETTLTIVSNQVTGSTGAGSTNGALFNQTAIIDQEAYMDVATLPTAGDWVSIWIRGDTGGTNTYILRVTPSTTTWDWRKRVAGGASTSIATNTTTALLAADSVGVSVVGSTLTAYRQTSGTWSTVFSTTDTAVTAAGLSGIELLNNVSIVDNFGGGPLVSSTIHSSLPFMSNGRI